jgi:hypothetical protein
MEIKDIKKFFGPEWNDLIDRSFKRTLRLNELSLHERFGQVILALGEGLRDTDLSKILDAMIILALSEEDIARSVDITHIMPNTRDEMELPDGKIMVHNIQYQDPDYIIDPNA